jgi:hypothetical protein
MRGRASTRPKTATVRPKVDPKPTFAGEGITARRDLTTLVGNRTMVHARNSTLRASAVAALIQIISPQTGGADDRAAPAVTLRLLPQQAPASICREVLIGPRAAEQRRASTATRRASIRGVSQTEWEQAELAYGFVVIDDTAHEIDGIDCSPLGDASNGSGTPN